MVIDTKKMEIHYQGQLDYHKAPLAERLVISADHTVIAQSIVPTLTPATTQAHLVQEVLYAEACITAPSKAQREPNTTTLITSARKPATRAPIRSFP